MIGAWNKVLVAAGSVLPGVGNHFASLGAWEEQLTDRPVAPDRADNLTGPQDHETDHGARGGFDEQAHGFADPRFLRTLPHAAAACS